MVLKGAPLPSSDASVKVMSSAALTLAVIAMTCSVLFSSAG